MENQDVVTAEDTKEVYRDYFSYIPMGIDEKAAYSIYKVRYCYDVNASIDIEYKVAPEEHEHMLMDVGYKVFAQGPMTDTTVTMIELA